MVSEIAEARTALKKATYDFLKGAVGESIATSVVTMSDEEVLESIQMAPKPRAVDVNLEPITEYFKKIGLSDSEVAGICMNMVQVSESDDLNTEYNAIENLSQELRQPLSDAQAFSALYNKGLVDKSYVSQYVASQKQELRSALSDLMGREWARRAWSSMFPKTQLDAWIEATKILNWNKSILLGKVEDLPSYTELATALLFNTNNLESTIADGIYEDMCVNAIVCYNFAALVASVAKQDKNIMDKLKDNYDSQCEYFGFMTNFGCNGIFALCDTALNILRAIMMTENGLPLDSGCKAGAKNTEATWDNSYGRNASVYFNLDIGNSFRESYVMELCRVLASLEKRHGYKLSQDDADAFKIPHSILIGDRYPSYKQPVMNFESQLSQLEETLTEGCESLKKACEKLDDNDSSVTDSLGSTQVESVIIADKSFEPISSSRIIRLAMENEQTFNKALAKNDMQEAVRCLAMNIVIEQKLFPELESSGKCVNITAMSDIRYKNTRYTSIVETGSNESMSRYIEEHQKELLDEVFKRA